MEEFATKTEDIIKLSEEDLNANLDQLEDCIATLENNLEKLIKPKKRRWFGLRQDTGVNWFEGAGIGNCGAVVTNYLDDKNLIEYQERSAKVWAQAILKVCGHYHHMVGPAMVANAKISEKQGNIDRVKEICKAIVQDFETPLVQCEKHEFKPDREDEDFESIKSLEYALDKLIKYGEGTKKLDALEDRVRKIWLKPEYSEE